MTTSSSAVAAALANLPSFAALVEQFPTRNAIVREVPSRYKPQAVVWGVGTLAADHPLVTDPSVVGLIQTSSMYQDTQRPAGYPSLQGNSTPYYVDPIALPSDVHGVRSYDSLEFRARMSARTWAMGRHHAGHFGVNNGEGGSNASGGMFDFGICSNALFDSQGTLQQRISWTTANPAYHPLDAALAHGAGAPFDSQTFVPPNGYAVPNMDTNYWNFYTANGQAALDFMMQCFIDEVNDIRSVLPIHWPAYYANDTEDYFNQEQAIHSIQYVPTLGAAQLLEGYSATPSPNVRGFGVPGYVKFFDVSTHQQAKTLAGVATNRFSTEVVARNRSGQTFTLEQFLTQAQADGIWDGTWPLNHPLSDTGQGRPLDAMAHRMVWFTRHIRDRIGVDVIRKRFRDASGFQMLYSEYNHTAFDPISQTGGRSKYHRGADGFFLCDMSTPSLYTAQYDGQTCASVDSSERAALITQKLSIVNALDKVNVEVAPWEAYPVTNGSNNFSYGDEDLILEGLKQVWAACPNLKRFHFWPAGGNADALARVWSAFRAWVWAQRPTEDGNNDGQPPVVMRQRRAVVRAFLQLQVEEEEGSVVLRDAPVASPSSATQPPTGEGS